MRDVGKGRGTCDMGRGAWGVGVREVVWALDEGQETWGGKRGCEGVEHGPGHFS